MFQNSFFPIILFKGNWNAIWYPFSEFNQDSFSTEFLCRLIEVARQKLVTSVKTFQSHTTLVILTASVSIADVFLIQESLGKVLYEAGKTGQAELKDEALKMFQTIIDSNPNHISGNLQWTTESSHFNINSFSFVLGRLQELTSILQLWKITSFSVDLRDEFILILLDAMFSFHLSLIQLTFVWLAFMPISSPGRTHGIPSSKRKHWSVATLH